MKTYRISIQLVGVNALLTKTIEADSSRDAAEQFTSHLVPGSIHHWESEDGRLVVFPGDKVAYFEVDEEIEAAAPSGSWLPEALRDDDE